MNVYHGSYTEIGQIDLSRCEPYRDFGQGFYVTKYRSQAKEWARRRGRNSGGGVVTEFEFHYSELVTRNCKVLRFDDYNEQWLDFVVLNRDDTRPSPAHDYDIVEGPVADDKVRNRIVNYLNGEMSKTDFLEELKWHEQTHQICFCTVASLVFLRRSGSKVLGDGDLEYHVKNIGEPLLEHLMLDHNMDEVRATNVFYTSDTFAQLADAASGLHLRPWQEIYAMLRAEMKI